MMEKDWLEELKQEAQQVPVPEALEPEAVKQQLEDHMSQGRNRGAAAGTGCFGPAAPCCRQYKWKRAIAAAAILVLAIGSAAAFEHFYPNQEIGDQSLQTAQTEETAQEQGRDTPDSYKQIYDLLDQITADEEIYRDSWLADKDIAVLEDQSLGAAKLQNSGQESAGEEAAQNISGTSKASAGDYSTTNVQTQQVDEGDLVKTDGTFIYTLDQNYNTITIVRAKGGKMEKTSVISLQGDFLPQEFYVKGDKLSVLGQEPEQGGSMLDQTAVYTFDIKNKNKPGQGERFTQSGTLSSSRMEGNHLYIFTSFYPFLPEKENKTQDYIPQVNGEVLKLSQISLPGRPQTPEFLVMASIDLSQPGKSADQKAVFAAGQTFYVSQNHIYAASVQGQDGRNTEIRKFAYEEGKITYKSWGKVKGYLESSFSMDEYKGNLRLVTTLDTKGGGTYNNVYVLDEDMEVAGSILKLAKDERIYSARFMGDTGYFVTFRETDPLFSVDLSQPTNPRIIGKLKIPGFSEYLHAYGKGRLLGVGMEANEQGETGGIKLSMFDISDPQHVKEKSVRTLKGTYDAEVLTNHHAILADVDKNLIAFAAEGDSGASYYVFEYKNKGFRLVLRKSLGHFGYGARGLYIGNTFYLVQADGITAYSMEDFQEIGKIGV